MPNANQATQPLSTTEQTQSTPFNTDNLPLHIATLTCVRAGKVMPFTREQTSAIDKAPIQAPVQVNFMGLVSDEQADRRHHGGPLKAVHQMSPATYAKINAEFDLNITVGTLGENLTKTPINGMPDLDESVVCIGDVFRYGEEANTNAVQLRIVQPRRPCFKINDQINLNRSSKHELPNIASWVSKNGISGWYFEVVQEGKISHDLPVYLVERPYPFATLEKLWQLVNLREKVEASVIEPWLEIDCLEDSWKKQLSRKIKT